jgi:hypothetical protein
MKINKAIFFAVLFTAGFACAETVSVDDSYSSATHTFTVADGTSVTTQDVFIVFSGELINEADVTASDDGDGRYLASIQLYLEMELFEGAPDPSVYDTAQAGVIALLNESSTTEGTLYGLTRDTSNDLVWEQLLDDSNNPIPINVGTTNVLTIILRYPDGNSYTDYEYVVTLAPADDPSSSISSQNITSPDTGDTGINSVQLVGDGSLTTYSSTSGDPAPLSAQIDFSVYYSNGEFLVNIFTVDENGSGELEVWAEIDGSWVLLGSVQAIGYDNNQYQLVVSGLSVGESYRFRVIDEEDQIHTSFGAIEVKSIQMQAVTLDMDTFSIRFNSESGKRYKVVTSADMNKPVAEWSVSEVQVYGPNGWTDFVPEFQGVPESDQTVVRVPRTSDAAFFKVLLID